MKTFVEPMPRSVLLGPSVADVKATHRLNGLRPIVGPNEHGRFPGSRLTSVPPVVLDANRLSDDMSYAMRYGRRTVLVNAVNSGFIRLFCAQHVIDEFYKHASEWALRAGADLARIHALWSSDYAPLIRVVDVPEGLLAPCEAGRIALMMDHESKKFCDPDDVPTATLALLLSANFISKDYAPLRAVYGPHVKPSDYEEWVDTLMTGGDAGVLSQMKRQHDQAATVSANLALGALRLAWTKVHPLAVLVLGGAVGYGYRRTPAAARQRAADVVNGLLENYGAITSEAQRDLAAFLSAAAPMPKWAEVAQFLAPEAVLLRACLVAMARRGCGDCSAAELAMALPSLPVPQSEARVRAVLRRSPALYQHRRGRFQVGRPVDGPPQGLSPHVSR